MQHNIYFTLCARMISINKLRPGCNVAFHKIVSNLHGSEKSLLFLPIFIRFGTCEMLQCYPGSRGFSCNCCPRKMQRLNRAQSLSGDCSHCFESGHSLYQRSPVDIALTFFNLLLIVLQIY